MRITLEKKLLSIKEGKICSLPIGMGYMDIEKRDSIVFLKIYEIGKKPRKVELKSEEIDLEINGEKYIIEMR